MRKLLIFLPFVLLANQTVPMPPMPPAMNLGNKKADVQKNAKSVLPKECRIIPPMIIFLPPPLENSLVKCKNRLFKPKLNYAKKIFAKKHIKVKSVNTVEGFNELYKIKTDKGNFYCNKTLSKCFKVYK